MMFGRDFEGGCKVAQIGLAVGFAVMMGRDNGHKVLTTWMNSRAGIRLAPLSGRVTLPYVGGSVRMRKPQTSYVTLPLALR